MLKILLTPHPTETLPAHFGDVPSLTMEYSAIHPDLKKTNVENFLFCQMATGIGNFYNRDAKICAADALPGTNNTKFYGAALVQGFTRPIAWYAEILPDPHTHQCRECHRPYTQAEAAAMDRGNERYQPCGHHQTALKPIAK